MSDDLDFDMEVVENDELDDLDSDDGPGAEKDSASEGKERAPNDFKSENVTDGELRSEAGPEEVTSDSTAPTINPDVEGWSRLRLGKFASFQNGNAFSKSDWGEDGYPIIRIQNLTGETDEYNYYDGDLEDRYRVESGDTLLTWSGTIGVFKWEGPAAALNQHIFNVETIDEVNDTFFHFKLDELIPQLEALSHGSTMKHVRKADLVNIDVELPPLPEQRKIASVLFTVDQAIQKTEDIIEQAKRMKRGIRQDLLSSGISESGGLRANETQSFDSRDEREWGKIPQSWDFVELGELCSVQVGYAFKSDWYREEGEVRVLRGANVGYGRPDWSDEMYLETEKVSEYSDYLLEEGDIIIGMDRPLTQLGFKVSRIRKVDLPALLVQRVGSLIPEECDSDYLHVLLNDWRYQKQVIRRGQGMDIPHISKSDILAPKVPVPPPDEQRRVARVYQDLLRKVEEETSLLDDYGRLKKGLMQDLLTGEVRTADKAIEVLDEVVEHG